MIESLSTYSSWVALGAIFLQLVTAYLIVEHFYLKEKYLAPYVPDFGLAAVFVVSVTSAIFSLVYSEHFGFIPCGLCWVERGFLYSLVVLTGVALFKQYHGARDRAVADYGIALALIGALISLYHHYGQMAGGPLSVCPTAGVGSNCARRLVFEFGYMTLPLMAATTFAFCIVVFLIYRAARHQ
jgi:disulfide bond formation protein DsbB